MTARANIQLRTFVVLATVHLSFSAQAAELPKDVLETGGLTVVLGYGDGSICTELRRNSARRIHVLESDPERVAAARVALMDRDRYGRVTIEFWSGNRLPYASNLVNVIIVSNMECRVAETEISRVLAPRGVVVVPSKLKFQIPGLADQVVGDWHVYRKPVPATIDSWTHYLHDAGGNAVANDRKVGPPKRLQWAAGPDHARHHDALASLSAMVSSEGRLFTIYDEGPVSLIHCRPDWQLIARDAFNGAVLWKRPIPDWLTQFYFFRSGPVWLARRLVASGDRVYATLGLTAPISAMDAATGKIIQSYSDTEKTEEFVLHNGRLLAVIGDPEFIQNRARKSYYWRNSRSFEQPKVAKKVVACDAATGKLLWQYAGSELASLVPSTLCAYADQAFFLDGRSLQCLALSDGVMRWQSPFEMKGLFVYNYSATVVATEKAVLCLSTRQLAAFDRKSGQLLWKHDRGYLGFSSPGDLFVVGDTVWALPEIRSAKIDEAPPTKPEEELESPSFRNPSKGLAEYQGMDILTGKVTTSLSKGNLLPGGHHHRCYRNKATSRYLITGRRGVEFLGIAGDPPRHDWWIRGECQYGILPCNGLLYRPPDPCKCFGDVKLNGFLAFTGVNDTVPPTEPNVLLKGAAFGQRLLPPEKATTTNPAAESGGLWRTAGIGKSHDWPTYRHDIARSGYSPSALPKSLSVLWKRCVGSELGAVTIADGRLFVADLEANAVYCRNALTGEPDWTFVANGPVDSPPTIWRGVAFFGSRDGCVYAVRVTDGELIWRYRAAPEDRRILVEGRLESEWPVHGSVLVHNDIVYFSAGRSANLYGGVRFLGLRASDGTLLHEQTIAIGEQSPVSQNGTRLRTGPKGCLSDILVSDGTRIRMRQMVFDMKLASTGGGAGLIRSAGFLGTQSFYRQQWSLGADHGPWGKLLVFNETMAFGAQSPYAYLKNTLAMWPLTHRGHHHQQFSKYRPEQFPIGTRLYAQDNKPVARGLKPKNTVPKELEAYRRFSNPWKASTLAHRWTVLKPIQTQAMVLASDILAVAGWRDAVEVTYGAAPPPPSHPLREPMLLVMQATDGKILSEQVLPATPVFDGIAAASGRLYVSLKNGSIVCYGQRQSQ